MEIIGIKVQNKDKVFKNERRQKYLIDFIDNCPPRSDPFGKGLLWRIRKREEPYSFG